MTILAGDIKLLKADTMNDSPEGGGALTGSVIVDGVSNNIFDDISTLDRVYGAVHMRKAFGAIQTLTRDKYYGGHMIIAKLPGDTKLGINLFNTNDWFDRRPAAKSRVENYRAQGAKYSGFLWATQYAGSRVLTVFQSESAPIPGIGDVWMLFSSAGSQYIRIVRLENSVQSFTDAQGVFKRRILNIEISDVLTRDFVGAEINRLDTISPPATIFRTVVANAARYYSARPLSLAAAINNFSVKVDSVYSQVVPASQAEVALVDVTASGFALPVLDAAQNTVSFTTSVLFSANSLLYLGSPCLPGTLSIPVSGGTLVDTAGQVKIGETTVGTIAYAQGIITFAATSPSYSGSKTVTFRPAAAPERLADTGSVPVTASNRGYVWTFNINPAPKPGSLKVSYRALNKWYELNDNGSGGLVGTESGIGSGTVSYVTGSVSVTFAALPDVDSEIIYTWGNAADFFNRSNIAPGPLRIKKTLTQSGIDASTLTITWNDGAARTITCNTAGVLSGYGTGSINFAAGELEFTPTTLPLGGTTFTINYSYGTKITKTLTSFGTSGSMVTLDLGDANIIPGSIEVAWAGAWAAAPAPFGSVQLPVTGGTINQRDVDNGSGALKGGRSSSINYTTGEISFNPTMSAAYKEAVLTNARKKVLNSPWEINVGNRTSYVAKTATTGIPAAFAVQYRTAAAGSSVEETLTLTSLELDLTPDYAETIVAGSTLFDFGGRTYIDRLGQVYYGVDRANGAATLAGTIDYTTGNVTLTNWVPGASPTVTLRALVTTMNFEPVQQAVFRTPAAPVKVQSFAVRAVPADGGGQITATSGPDGTIQTADIYGYIEYETGVVNLTFGQWVTAAGNEAEPWYDATAVFAGQIFKPRHVFADTIIFNAVSYTYLPLSATILGLDPVRLPADGRVPVYAPGDVLVILHDQTTTGTFTSGGTTNLGRVRLAKLQVRDAGGNPLDTNKYTANLDTGIITWGNLAGVSQPLTITDRIEDMAVCTDVQINGTLTLSQPITHVFPANETLVANAIIFGDLYARTSIPFDQQTWTNVWSDTVIGSSVAAQYNNTQYPIQVDNASCIQEKWALIFTSSTTLNVIGQNVGQILTGVSIAANIAPINPNTGQPYFTIYKDGFGAGWASGNVLRFNTFGANAPTWIIQAIAQGPATDDDFTFCLEFRGDIDTP
ncbi:MAG: hypothetical protein Q7U98_17285 [Methylicorpusculum sp.]|uniref:hypothetical protein n=1 Tax=Methylicorpusculum sp. TaxID=2713644 RepID=UPI0027258EEF|nr:hypothetical protein [Methylicorpusculum sp.]MDO8940911.1 hypothetical protein [Methylicorpusculum sp.]MDP2202398.1 hypothetical protein [Methylicorpusculum sp.]